MEKEVERISEKRNSSILLVFVTVVLSMGLFFLLYTFNNKYTTKENKAIQGILYTDGEEDSVYYLSGEWEYYPDLLLTPQMLQENKDEYYRRYLFIGEYGGMDLGDDKKSPFGSGTYRLLVAFPEETRTYGLALNEVFSAYRLYINGRQIGEMGNPEPDYYEERIQNRMFTFEGKGVTEIMIAVTDRGSLSSGIQYVPVLGSPLQVNLRRGVAIFSNAFLLLMILFVLFVAFYMFVKSRNSQIGLFCLTCVCMMGYTGYPVLHTYFSLKVQPWYALELFSYYLMFSFLVLLQEKVMGRSKKSAVVFASVLAGMSLFLFMGVLFSAKLQTAKWMYFLSFLSDVMKWGTAVYLIGRMLLYKGQRYRSLFLTGAVVYGCSLVADRCWKLYEPILGGWFAEIGGNVLVILVGATLWMEIANAYTFRLTYEEKSRGMEQRLLMQKQHYEELNEKMEEIIRIRHDLRHHMRTVYAYAQEKDYENLKKYLESYAPVAETIEDKMFYSKNMTVDAVLHYYAGILKKEKIPFDCQMEIPEVIPISDMDLCKILGNLLENATEAVFEQKTRQEIYVRVKSRTKNRKLLLEISNTYSNEIREKGRYFYSTKHSGLGAGTASVIETTEKYGGFADFTTKEGVFQVNIFLPLE